MGGKLPDTYGPSRLAKAPFGDAGVGFVRFPYLNKVSLQLFSEEQDHENNTRPSVSNMMKNRRLKSQTKTYRMIPKKHS